LSFKGVLYLKHLMRGVKLGLFDEATAMSKFEAWNTSHEVLVAERQDKHKKAKAASRIQPIIKKVEAIGIKCTTITFCSIAEIANNQSSMPFIPFVILIVF
jgi:hypothetical protein